MSDDQSSQGIVTSQSDLAYIDRKLMEFQIQEKASRGTAPPSHSQAPGTKGRNSKREPAKVVLPKSPYPEKSSLKQTTLTNKTRQTRNKGHLSHTSDGVSSAKGPKKVEQIPDRPTLQQSSLKKTATASSADSDYPDFDSASIREIRKTHCKNFQVLLERTRETSKTKADPIRKWWQNLKK